MKPSGILLAATLLLSPAASAQERPDDAPRVPAAGGDAGARTAKSDKAWSRVVESFARALSEGDGPAVEGLLAAKSYVRRFEGGEFESAGEMLSRLARSTPVGQHAYFHPALVMAADIAADFKRATAVPEKVRLSFLIDDANEIKRANATAVQWVVEQLQVRQGSPVAVIVLWAPKQSPAAAAEGRGDAQSAAESEREPGEGDKTKSPEFEPVFVILRGEETDAHRFRINYVVYGNPLAGRE